MNAASHRPRVVLVTRKTGLELLRERRGTLDQARFYLQARGQSLDDYLAADERSRQALLAVESALPADQRRVRVDRQDLDRFLFAPEDVVLVVGQDGLVANVAKYLRGQRVVGINADPARFDGVLCRHPPQATPALLRWLELQDQSFSLERRTMVVAEREDGQRLLALNEVFVGHRSHQSARYTITRGKQRARHSSSGVLCTTGTGATGWARSIREQRRLSNALPRPEEPRLAWLVREPFPSVSTSTELDFGFLGPEDKLILASEMAEDGVAFADGIESDTLEFLGGQSLTLRRAEEVLQLVVPATARRDGDRRSRRASPTPPHPSPPRPGVR